MDLQRFQEVNKRRMLEVPKFNNNWPIELWALAICGEAGELANILKKVKRGDFPLEQVKQDVVKEVADVMSYCVSAMTCLDVDAGQELAKKFDEVSERVGWNGPRLYHPENNCKRRPWWEILWMQIISLWHQYCPALPHKFPFRDDPHCVHCGEFGPIAGRGCNWSFWYRFLFMFKFRIIMPDCPEGKHAKPLLTRWRLLHTKPISVFVHLFHRSDLDEFHDHPWNFWTFLLSSGYWEHQPGETNPLEDVAHWRPRFSLLHRPALHQHYVQILKPTWTIVVKTRTFRDWGFIVKGKWIKWNKMEQSKSRSICED